MTTSSTRRPRAAPTPTPAVGGEVVELHPAERVTKPRGAPASAEVVELYRLLYLADRPLSFDEIADQLTSAYRSHAYRHYRDELIAEGVPIKDDKWTDREKQTAWLWWVGELVELSRKTKHINVTAQSGGRSTGKRRDQLVYTSNRDKPPTVMVQVTEERLVQWTPSIGDTGKRHAAGMSFLQQVRSVLDAPELDATTARELLELAEKAIRTS